MKNIGKIVPVSELQSKASAVVNQVRKTHQPIVVTVNGRGVAALVDIDFYEGAMATEEEKKFADWKSRLKRADAELKAGKSVPLKQLKRK